MKKNVYFDSMKTLFNEMLQREFDAQEVHKVFGCIFNVVWYRKMLQKSETPEEEALARWSLSDANSNLDDVCRDFAFDEEVKAAVRNLTNKY